MHHIPPTISIKYSITPKWSKQQKIWSTENKLQQTTTSMAILVTITNIFTKIIYWTNSFIFRGCPRNICECYGWTVNHNVSFSARGINFLTKTTKRKSFSSMMSMGIHQKLQSINGTYIHQLYILRQEIIQKIPQQWYHNYWKQNMMSRSIMIIKTFQGTFSNQIEMLIEPLDSLRTTIMMTSWILMCRFSKYDWCIILLTLSIQYHMHYLISTKG